MGWFIGGKTWTACSTMSTTVVTTMMNSRPATTAQMDLPFMRSSPPDREAAREEWIVPPMAPGHSSAIGNRASHDQHRVAVGVEAVALLHRVRVGAAQRLLPRKRRDQEQQRGARQVEVGEQRVHRLEPVGRQDVLAGPAAGGLELAAVGVTGRLERPHPRGP